MLKLFKSKKKTTSPLILIVDDEPALVTTIQCRLEFHQYQVITASNGKEGLEKAISEKPDLILLDNNMPIMDGPEMLRQLRNNPKLKDTAVIMCTALCDPQDIATASSYNISDYITKPFDCVELIAKITNALSDRDME